MERDYSDKLSIYKPEWPAMQQQKATIEQARKNLETLKTETASRAIEAARTEYLIALRREQSVKGMARSQKTEALAQGNDAIEYRNLKVEIDTKRALLDSLLEAAGRDGGHLPPSRRADHEHPHRGPGAASARALQAVLQEEPAHGDLLRHGPRRGPRVPACPARPQPADARTGRAVPAASRARRDPGLRVARFGAPDACVADSGARPRRSRPRGLPASSWCPTGAAVRHGGGLSGLPRGAAAIEGGRRSDGRRHLGFPAGGKDGDGSQPRHRARPARAPGSSRGRGPAQVAGPRGVSHLEPHRPRLGPGGEPRAVAGDRQDELPGRLRRPRGPGNPEPLGPVVVGRDAQVSRAGRDQLRSRGRRHAASSCSSPTRSCSPSRSTACCFAFAAA